MFIGGAAVSDEYAREIGADAFCTDGSEAKALVGRWDPLRPVFFRDIEKATS